MFTLRSRRRFLAAEALAASLLTLLLFKGNAQAQFSVCRSDPIATLSNGAQITMIAEVQDTPSDITHASFVLHVPVGVKVKSVQYDPTYDYLESFSWAADENTGIYHTDTTVTTKTSMISVSANVSPSGMTCQLPSKSTHGNSGHSIPVNFKC